MLRLETLAESVLAGSLRDNAAAAEFPGRFEAALDDFGPDVVAFKSILAYRSGVDIAAEPPSSDDGDRVRPVAAIRRGAIDRSGAPAVPDLDCAVPKAVAGSASTAAAAHRIRDTDLDLYRANPFCSPD